MSKRKVFRRKPSVPASLKGVVRELTKRQRQVFMLVLGGFDRQAMQKVLSIQGRMIRYHLMALYRKSGAPSLQALQAKLGVLKRIRLPDGRVRLGTLPKR